MKNYDRSTKEYILAERIVHLEEALEIANENARKLGHLGVLPGFSVSFRRANKFHKKVRVVLDKYHG